MYFPLKKGQYNCLRILKLCDLDALRLAEVDVSLMLQHWTPQRKIVETVPLPEDCEVPGAEALAASAKPLVRKQKPGLQFSRWKNQHISENVEEKVSKEQFDPTGPVEQSLRLDNSKAAGGKNAEGGQSRPRVTFTLPTEKCGGSPKIGVCYLHLTSGCSMVWFHRV